jgi:hypothetical protein
LNKQQQMDALVAEVQQMLAAEENKMQVISGHWSIQLTV